MLIKKHFTASAKFTEWINKITEMNTQTEQNIQEPTRKRLKDE
jgi:hypothetical protein